MYLIEHFEEDYPMLQRYYSKKELLEVISSLKEKKINFKVFCMLDVTDILI